MVTSGTWLRFDLVACSLALGISTSCSARLISRPRDDFHQFCFLTVAECLSYTAVHRRWSGLPCCCCPYLEQSAPTCNVRTLYVCFPRSPQGFPLQAFIPFYRNTSVRSDSCHFRTQNLFLCLLIPCLTYLPSWWTAAHQPPTLLVVSICGPPVSGS